MLVLSRKKNQEIVIGEDITIMVVDVRNGIVQLGITAPRFMEVDRAEIRKSKRADHESNGIADRCIVVRYGHIGNEWIVSLQIEPGIHRRISSHLEKSQAVIEANIAAGFHGLDMRVIEPEPVET